MNGKQKKILIVCLCLLLLAAIGMKCYSDRYAFFQWQSIPRDTRQLDLRESDVSVKAYQRLQKKLADCRILWNVPFQEQRIPSDSESLKITSLTEADMPVLECFAELKELDASGCDAYGLLTEFRTRHPECKVKYQVIIGGKAYDSSAVTLNLQDPDLEEVAEKLPWMQRVSLVYLSGNLPERAEMEALQQSFPEMDIRWKIPAGKGIVDSGAERLDLSGVPMTTSQVKELLHWLPRLNWVDMTDCGLSDKDMMALADAYPDIFFKWDMTIGALKIPTDSVEVDVSNQKMESTSEIESLLPYFPNVEKVIMSHCGFDNETMAALNDRYEDIRFVWTVRIRHWDVRTDDTWFYPVKLDREAVVNSNDLYPLRYCTDMVCIDVGHMWHVDNCEWAAFMPNLKYLIIAYTSVSDLTPLTGLKNLVYLEIFKSKVTDYSPLVTCTALEDLNLSMTQGDYRPLTKMTWLKNVWWSGIPYTSEAPCSGAREELPKALPNTNLVFHMRTSARDSGWRKIPNYFAMRDYLGMFYLS